MMTNSVLANQYVNLSSIYNYTNYSIRPALPLQRENKIRIIKRRAPWHAWRRIVLAEFANKMPRHANLDKFFNLIRIPVQSRASSSFSIRWLITSSSVFALFNASSAIASA